MLTFNEYSFVFFLWVTQDSLFNSNELLSVRALPSLRDTNKGALWNYRWLAIITTKLIPKISREDRTQDRSILTSKRHMFMLCCYLCVKRNLLYVYIVIIGNFQPIRYKIIFNTRICLNNVSTFTTYVQVVNLCICWDTCWSVTNGKSVRSIRRTKG